MKSKEIQFFKLLLISCLLYQQNGNYSQVVEARAYSLQSPAATRTASPMLNPIGQIGGYTNSIFVQGNYAFVGIGTRVWILNITDRTKPQLVGMSPVMPGPVFGIAVSGNYAYVADNWGYLHVLNISTLTNPTLVYSYQTYGNPNQVVVSGGYAYMSNDSTQTLYVFNISNPANPALAGTYYTGKTLSGEFILGSYAYLTIGFDGLMVVNVANPSLMTVAGSIDTPGWADRVTVAGNYAYIADQTGGMRVINVSTLSAMSEVGFYNESGNGYTDIALVGKYVYLCLPGKGVTILDITNPGSPVKVGQTSIGDYIHRVFVNGGYAFLAANDAGLKIINVASPTSPSLSSVFDKPGVTWRMKIQDTYIYALDLHNHLNIINFITPSTPVLTGSYTSTSNNIHDLIVDKNLVYLGTNNKLEVIDVTNKSNPTLKGQCASSSDMLSLAKLGNYLYAASSSNGLLVFDVTNPASPVQTNTFPLTGNAQDIKVQGNNAYLADGSSGLIILDISNPANIHQVGHWISPGNASKIAIFGNYVYLYDGELRIIDIHNPASPTQKGHIPYNSVQDMVASGIFVYLAANLNGFNSFELVDRSTPSVPSNFLSYDTYGNVYAVGLSDNKIFISNGEYGLEILLFKADLGLRPNPDGYSFSNDPKYAPAWGGYPSNNPEDITYDDMVRLFGYDNVYINILGNTVLNPLAVIWHNNSNQSMNHGHCYGMAVTSLRIYKGLDTPSQIIPNTSTTYALTLNSDVRRYNAYYQAMQTVQPVASLIDQSLKRTPSQILSDLYHSFKDGTPDPVVLLLTDKNKTSGHAVAPYIIQDNGNGIYIIFTYDSNNTQSFESLQIDTNTESWTYKSNELNFSGDAASHSLGVIHLSLNTAPFASPFSDCPWCDQHASKATAANSVQNEVWLNGPGHLMTTDAHGHRMGFLGDNLINEITGAFEVPYIGGLGIPSEPIYSLPLTDTYTIHIDGQTITQSGLSTISQFGQGSAISVEGIQVFPTTYDQMILANDGTSVLYQSKQANQITMKLGLANGNPPELFQLGGVNIGSNQQSKVQIDQTHGQLIFDNSGNKSGNYAFRMELFTSNQRLLFYHSEISIEATDTQYIDYGAWNGSGNLTIEIDHGSDGTIDSTIHIRNEAYNIFLPTIIQH